MKTASLKASEIEKKWYLIDAANIVTGRLAVEVAGILRGKHKPSYTPHMDCGDHVIIVNADKIALTGRKWRNKIYYRHTGYPGGIKETTPARLLEKHPDRILRLAVQRMIPKGPLGRDQLRHLRIYAGTDHPHEGQKPEVIDMASRNRKNLYGMK